MDFKTAFHAYIHAVRQHVNNNLPPERAALWRSFNRKDAFFRICSRAFSRECNPEQVADAILKLPLFTQTNTNS